MRINQLKEDIIEDLKVCISYEQDKENDILCMMERYLKTKTNREKIKDSLRKLLNGEEYENPFKVYYFYGQKEICNFEEILCDYIRKMDYHHDKAEVLGATIFLINELYDRCSGELIDEWRKEKLEELLILVAENVGFNTAQSIILSTKRW